MLVFERCLSNNLNLFTEKENRKQTEIEQKLDWFFWWLKCSIYCMGFFWWGERDVTAVRAMQTERQDQQGLIGANCTANRQVYSQLGWRFNRCEWRSWHISEISKTQRTAWKTKTWFTANLHFYGEIKGIKTVSLIALKDLWLDRRRNEVPNLFVQVIKGTVETSVETQGIKLILRIRLPESQSKNDCHFHK